MPQHKIHFRRIIFDIYISIPFYYIFDTQRDGILHIAIPVTAFMTLRDFFYSRATRLVSPRLLPRCISSARNLR